MPVLTPPPPLRALRRQYALLASRKSTGTARPRLSRDAAVQPSPQHAVVQPSGRTGAAPGWRECRATGSVRSASELSSASQCERVERERLPPKSVFRRQLPAPLVAFSSPQGRRNFAEAMAAGQLEPYFPLSEQFVTQDEPTFCGLTTLTMVLNALNIDPRRRWRDEAGPGWRWWSDEMLPASCTVPLEQVRAEGTTMDDFARLAVANGARVCAVAPRSSVAPRSLSGALSDPSRRCARATPAARASIRSAPPSSSGRPRPPPLSPSRPSAERASGRRVSCTPRPSVDGTHACTSQRKCARCRRRPLFSDWRLSRGVRLGAGARRRPL